MTPRTAFGRMLPAVLAGTTFVSNCGPASRSLVPSDYRSRLTEVRNCRSTSEHLSPTGEPSNPPIANIRVLINPESADAYRANQNPLPAGTLVIKEETSDGSCQSIVGWSVMHKEPGFDPAHGDWHYQHVLRDGTIDADGRVPHCLGTNGCHSNPAMPDGCVWRDYMCTAP